MSRNSCTDEWDGDDVLAYGRQRGAISSAIRGRRGQAFLRELLAALDAMPVKELVEQELDADGRYCALGAVGKARGTDLAALNPENQEQVADVMGIARALAGEITWVNDMHTPTDMWLDFDGPPERWRSPPGDFVPDPEAPAKRWQTVREWVVSQLLDEVKS